MDSGRRTTLFGEVNDRIFDLLSTTEPDLPGGFFCECGRECGQRVELLPAEFAQLRKHGRTVRSDACGRSGPFRRRRERAAAAGSVPVLG